MTAPYQTVCNCGRTILRHVEPDPSTRRCADCRAEADKPASGQLDLFAPVDPHSFARVIPAAPAEPPAPHA